MSETSTSPVSQATAIPAVGTYRVIPQSSSIRFTVRHFFGVVSENGTFDVSSGDIVVADPLAASTVTVSAPTASFTTKNPQRDKHVKTADFLDAEAFPELTFRSTAVVADGSTWIVRGMLTARGVEAPLDLRVREVDIDARGFTLTATARADRYAHDVTKMKGMVARRLDLLLSVRAERT